LLATLPQKNKSKTQQPSAGANPKGALGQNIPNPATESTTIVYELFGKGFAEIKIYNALGQLLQNIQQGMQEEGIYEVEISFEKIPAGLYQYALYIDGIKIDAKKLVVTK
jgi:hypothetical protein